MSALTGHKLFDQIKSNVARISGVITKFKKTKSQIGHQLTQLIPNLVLAGYASSSSSSSS